MESLELIQGFFIFCHVPLFLQIKMFFLLGRSLPNLNCNIGKYKEYETKNTFYSIVCIAYGSDNGAE